MTSYPIEHSQFGATVRSEIIRRFPLLIVDELQDTGYFLGKSIRLLLNEPGIRGVLVGDPDQAIFEFNGATPDLFDTFELIGGAVPLTLSRSRRCPVAAVKAARHLKDSAGRIDTTNGREGRAILVTYNGDNMKADVYRVVEAIVRRHTDANIKVIARSNQTVEDLLGHASQDTPKLGCPPLYHMNRAVRAFRQGRQVAALAAVRAALDLAVFEHEGVTDGDLKERGIDSSDWKSLCVRCLLRADAMDIVGSVFDWQKAAAEILNDELSASNVEPELRSGAKILGPQRRGDWARSSADYLPRLDATQPTLAGVSVQTVHGVKGETHDDTIFVCPPSRADRCLSAVWWSAATKDREERRIAYVAMTRTQGNLVLCVCEDCFQRLKTRHPDFLADFECLDAEGCVASFERD